MNCDQVQRLLHGYVDGELDVVNALEIEAHLHDCPDCAREYRELAAMQSVLKNPALFHPAPPGLQKRVTASVRKPSPKAASWTRLPWGWVTAAVLLAVMAAFWAGGAGPNRLVPGRGDALAQEVLTAHVRSLQVDHLTDVASSDQHTVKPWFDGKLDFSPTVVDLATEGYPLAGGRLDYLDGHPVAALVYGRYKHVINLFVWPAAGPAQAPVASTQNGYNQVHWVQSGMAYWAISDVNREDLSGFVELVQKEFH